MALLPARAIFGAQIPITQICGDFSRRCDFGVAPNPLRLPWTLVASISAAAVEGVGRQRGKTAESSIKDADNVGASAVLLSARAFGVCEQRVGPGVFAKLRQDRAPPIPDA